MAEFPASVPSPAIVHPRAIELLGHHPHWRRQRYRAQPERLDHFRRCSFCNSIHPSDLKALLRASRSYFSDFRGRHKRILMTPNPIAGRLVQKGWIYGPVFSREVWPISLPARLSCPESDDWHPTIAERLKCHFEIPRMIAAEAMIAQPFYLNHSTDALWDEILAAADQGERNASLSRA